jgi:hypothetical protein
MGTIENNIVHSVRKEFRLDDGLSKKDGGDL